MARVQLERAVKGLARLIKTSLARENVPQVFHQLVVLRLASQSLPQLGLCFRKIRFQHAGFGQAQAARYGIGLDRRSAAKAPRGLFTLIGQNEEFAKRGMRFSQLRGQLDGPAIGCRRFDAQVLPLQRHTQIVVGGSIVSQSRGQAQAGSSFGEAIETQQRPAERVVRGGFARSELDRAAKRRNCGGRPAGLDEPNATLSVAPGCGASVGRDPVPGNGAPPVRVRAAGGADCNRMNCSAVSRSALTSVSGPRRLLRSPNSGAADLESNADVSRFALPGCIGAAPQHSLNFRPLPQMQGSLRPGRRAFEAVEGRSLTFCPWGAASPAACGGHVPPWYRSGYVSRGRLCIQGNDASLSDRGRAREARPSHHKVEFSWLLLAQARQRRHKLCRRRRRSRKKPWLTARLRLRRRRSLR